MDVLALSAEGGVRTPYRADSIDITASTPQPRRPLDQEIADHTTRLRNMFAHLDEFWTSPGDTARTLSGGLTDRSVSVLGAWPDTGAVVTLRHPSLSGLVLRRRLPLFDDAGQPIDHGNADDTGYLAPADEAVDGILDS